MLQASKNEARLAVDLYNRSGNERQLEVFVVHMAMAWLKLFQATLEKSGGDIYVRDRRGHRVRHEDGDWKHRALSDLVAEFFKEGDPRRSNLEFFIGMRNRIEQHFERDIATLISGKTQAFLLNYENTLVAKFGSGEALGDELRFPLFVSVLTDEAVDAARRVRARVPKGVLEWVQDFEAGLDPDVASDQAFDFRVYLVPYTGPKSSADVSMTFLHRDSLTDEQLATLDHFPTITREVKVPVEDLGKHLPGDVVAAVKKRVSVKFNLHVHRQAWRYFNTRPSYRSAHPERTRREFCHYNAAFKQYTYTDAWVDLPPVSRTVG